MTETEGSSAVDYSFFWKALKKPDGGLIVSFDAAEFSSVFGARAGKAMKDYLHYQDNTPVSSEEKRRFGRAIETVRKFVDEDPKVIYASRDRALIEDL